MRSKLVLFAVVASLIGVVPVIVSAQSEREQVCTDPDESFDLFAERLSKTRIGYGLTPGRATVPGPTIEMIEGDCIAVTLVNDTDVRLSMHAHGVHYTPASDGTPHNSSCVGPGKSRTFVFSAPGPRDGAPGTAGYWHYHDHCMKGAHGTAGTQAGLFGAIIVRRPGDPVPDREPFVLTMGPGKTINKKVAPRTPLLEANQGERVEFVVIGEGDLMHTFHLHGHRWADNRTGIPSSNADRIIDNITVGPADSFGFQMIAGDGVGPGAWMYHCHVQNHSDLGMVG
ncbi:MAG TPA: multicopper oxidase domain-containing protein, partial [Actinomycetota bacterium]|nr:multicopper oxidase domain-containing protein [Actinomycetota bacterium]